MSEAPSPSIAPGSQPAQEAPRRARGRPRKPISAAAPSTDPAAPRRRGRKIGFRLPTFAQLDELTLEDFSFVRGIYNGMEPRDSFLRFYANIHFDVQGVASVPHGLSLTARFKQLEARILAAAASSAVQRLQQHAQTLAAELPEQASDQAQRRGLEELFAEWANNLPEDMYSESELPERFKEYLADNAIKVTTQQGNEVSRAAMIERKVKALNELQTALAYRPRQDAATSIWLATPVRAALERLQIYTLGQLVRYISATGRNWHRSISRLGEVRATRLQAWLEDHAATLGHIERSSIGWAAHKPLISKLSALQRAPEVAVLKYQGSEGVATPDTTQIVQRAGIAPLELLRVPPELDGSQGLYRVAAPNHFGARDDMQAITIWLSTFLRAGKQRTFEAYRREVERFYIWCMQEARVALASVSTAHAIGYQQFLAKIPHSYVGQARVTREDPRWRPWRGQLTARSQTYALTVLKVLMEALVKAGYLSGNAFAALKSSATLDQAMDTSRSLNAGDIEWVRQALAQRESSHAKISEHDQDVPAPSPALGAARARRLKFILNILLTTGLRLDELAKARASDMYPAQGSPDVPAEGHLLRVVGKGKRVRTVFISPAVHQLMLDHHADVERVITETHGASSQKLLAFRVERPMVGALTKAPSPAGAPSQTTANTTSQSHALGLQGIYRTLKAFFRAAANRELRRATTAKIEVERRLKKAGAAAQAERYAALALEAKRLDHDRAMWQRRARISTHWLRHTFAKEVLRTNPSDSGLKLAQQLLGHASITTTAVYAKQDDTAKVKAARLVFPDGI
ncbi:phage integrase family protein [Hydrogenophaga sp. PML113]|uniref:phage integrase family protein n=1 Tax=Hydrogenophaga sp. PML113 TaxID=1899350 RepID=UPI000878A928|nr:phage integrase family protein [Hydrogenophaga sp. PML113]